MPQCSGTHIITVSLFKFSTVMSLSRFRRIISSVVNLFSMLCTTLYESQRIIRLFYFVVQGLFDGGIYCYYFDMASYTRCGIVEVFNVYLVISKTTLSHFPFSRLETLAYICMSGCRSFRVLLSCLICILLSVCVFLNFIVNIHFKFFVSI